MLSLMIQYTHLLDPPVARQPYCEGGKECHFTEGSVMIALAIHLLESGATDVHLHPDGEHGKRYDLKASLEAHGFGHIKTLGTTKYGGVYSRGNQTVTVTIRSGLGDVVSRVGERIVVAECKGGVVRIAAIRDNNQGFGGDSAKPWGC